MRRSNSTKRSQGRCSGWGQTDISCHPTSFTLTSGSRKPSGCDPMGFTAGTPKSACSAHRITFAREAACIIIFCGGVAAVLKQRLAPMQRPWLQERNIKDGLKNARLAKVLLAKQSRHRMKVRYPDRADGRNGTTYHWLEVAFRCADRTVPRVQVAHLDEER
jgi:hypothetical protein